MTRLTSSLVGEDPLGLAPLLRGTVLREAVRIGGGWTAERPDWAMQKGACFSRGFPWSS